MPPRFTPPTNNIYSKPSFGASDTLLHVISRETLQNMHPVYVEAFEKARSMTRGKRIDMRSFTNYADLDKDMASVNNKIREYSGRSQIEGNMEAMVQAEILEALIYDMVKSHGWFGANVSGILPSAFDDLFLGNDLILEQKHGDGWNSYSGVGIDVTLGEVSFTKKITDTKERLSKGGLSWIKYFESPAGNFKGSLYDIPHFVIGVDRESLFQLTSMWCDGDMIGMSKHPSRKSLLKMMILECDEFSRDMNEVIVKAYQREKIFLENILSGI